MQKKIKDISKIIVGYTFRGAIEENSQGDFSVLQAKNILQGENIFSTDSLSAISSTKFRSAAMVKYNDILIVSRGRTAGSFKTSVFKNDNLNVVASSSVLIIRATDDTVLPEYISLYLNSSEGQMAISQIATGSHFKTLLRKDLEDLEIPVPTIVVQKNLIALGENIMKQEKITSQLTQIRYNLMNGVFGQVNSL